MKTGINQWVFPPGMPAQEALKRAKDIGFESFEVCVGDEGPVSLDASQRDVRVIRHEAEKLGIEVSSVGSGMGWKYPMTSTDPTVREKGKEAAARTLQIAHWLGADAVLVVPGVVDADTPYDTALENALTAIQDLIPAAEQLQVAIAVENVWNKFLLSPTEMRDFIDQCESEYVAAFFDIGNVLPYGYPEQWIRILGRRIRKIHAKDFRVSAGNMDGFVMLMEGDAHWPAVAAALKEVDYTGPLTAEYGAYRYSLDTTLRHCLTGLEAIITMAK